MLLHTSINEHKTPTDVKNSMSTFNRIDKKLSKLEEKRSKLDTESYIKYLENRLLVENEHASIFNLYDNSSNPVVIAEEESGQIIYVNEGASVFFRCGEEKLVGNPLSTLHPNKKELNTLFNENSVPQEINAVLANGTIKEVRVIPVPFETVKSKLIILTYENALGKNRYDQLKHAFEKIKLANLTEEKSILQVGLSQCLEITHSTMGFVSDLSFDTNAFKISLNANIVDSSILMLAEHILSKVYANEGFREGETHVLNELASNDVVRMLLFPIYEEAILVKIVGVLNKQSMYDQNDKTNLFLLSEHFWMLYKKKDLRKRLNENSKLVEIAIESRKDGVWDWNLQTGQLTFNVQSAKMLGYKYFEMPETIEKFFTICNQSDISKLKQKLFKHFRSGRNNFTANFRVLSASGVWLWVEVNGKIQDRNTKLFPTRIVGTITDVTELKLAEESIKEVEDRYRYISGITSEGIILLKEGLVVDCNDAALLSLGLAKNQVLGSNIRDVFGDKNPELLEFIDSNTNIPKTFSINLNFSESIHIEIENIRKNEESKFDVIAIRNVTERIKAQKALAESERKHKIVSNILTDFLYTVENASADNPQINWISGPFEEHVGFTIEEVNRMPKGYHSIINIQDLPKVKEQLSQSMENDMACTIEYRIKTKAGNEIWVSDRIKIMWDDENENFTYIGGVQNITRSKERERELLRISNLLQRAGKLAQLGLWEHNIATNVFICSNELAENFGLASNKSLTSLKSFMQFVHPDDRENVQFIFSDYNLLNEQNLLEFKVIAADNIIRHVVARSVVEFNSLGNPERAYGFIQDITTQKVIESELLLAKEKAEESERLKHAFLSNVTHEIRTPMNGMIGFAEMLKIPNLPEEKRNKYIGIIQNSSQQLLKILNDIIHVSKIESEALSIQEECVDLYQYMDELSRKIQLSENLKSNIEVVTVKGIYQDYASVYIDIEKVNEIFDRIISNAIKFTNEGSIEVGFTLKNKKEILFFVDDSGIGISKEKQEVIFERFRQADEGMKRQYGGTGLGLAIVTSLVRKLGGEISIESELTKGTTFYFTVPYKPSILNYDQDIKTVEESLIVKFRVLLVEDNFINQEQFYYSLSKLGADVTIAPNSKIGREHLLSNSYDCVFLDTTLPDDDFENLLEHIKKFDANLPIVLLTSGKQESQRYNNYDVLSVMQKPVEKTQLLKIISSIS